MTSRALPAIEPEEILHDLLGFDAGLRQEAYYGERSIFYNPGGVAPLGTIFASIKDRDGPNDKGSNLSREGVYRFAFCLTRTQFAERFGETPRRPPKGSVVNLDGHELTRLGELTPHPVYAWMRWAQILSPTRAQYESLKPLLDESLSMVKAKWAQRRRGSSST
jgi:Family of unknown function (DUF6194)